MDGNSRWALSHGLTIFDGYQKGAEVAKKVIHLTIKHQISHLTLFAFSIENWCRPEVETQYLQGSLQLHLESEAQNYKEYGIKLTVIGERQMLNSELQNIITKAENMTANNCTLNLYIAFSYSGRSEIMYAYKKMLQSGVKAEELTERQLRQYFYSPTMPDIDLLIRTSGEQRVSNFLLWHLAYSELYFTNKYWPDFSESDFQLALEDFLRRKRNFGMSRQLQV